MVVAILWIWTVFSVCLGLALGSHDSRMQATTPARGTPSRF